MFGLNGFGLGLGWQRGRGLQTAAVVLSEIDAALGAGQVVTATLDGAPYVLPAIGSPYTIDGVTVTSDGTTMSADPGTVGDDYYTDQTVARSALYTLEGEERPVRITVRGSLVPPSVSDLILVGGQAAGSSLSYTATTEGTVTQTWTLGNATQATTAGWTRTEATIGAAAGTLTVTATRGARSASASVAIPTTVPRAPAGVEWALTPKYLSAAASPNGQEYIGAMLDLSGYDAAVSFIADNVRYSTLAGRDPADPSAVEPFIQHNGEWLLWFFTGGVADPTAAYPSWWTDAGTPYGDAGQTLSNVRIFIGEAGVWSAASTTKSVTFQAPPAQFADAGWSVADAGTDGQTINVTVTTLPADNGESIDTLYVRYRTAA